MAFANTNQSYGSVAKFFHWLIALLVITLLIAGYFMGDIVLRRMLPNMFGGK